MTINLDTLNKERALVRQNVANLEAQVNQLNAALQQANANLLASRGALLGFDRLEEVSKAPADPAPAAPTDAEAQA